MKLLPLVLLVPAIVTAQTPAKLRLVQGDLYRIKDVGSPVLSPDGQWVAYTVSTADSAKDKRNSDVYMVSWDGTRTVQLTSSPGVQTSSWSIWALVLRVLFDLGIGTSRLVARCGRQVVMLGSDRGRRPGEAADPLGR